MNAKKRILIVYQSRYGTTEKTSNYLASKLENADITVVQQGKDKLSDIESFDIIIIGGSIRAGMIQKGIKKFINKYRDILLSKDLGLYLCCMEEGDKALKEFNDSYPEDLRNHAKASGLFGGEFNFDRMGFLEKKIIRKAVGVEDSVSKINYDAIDAFAVKMQS